MTGIRQALQRPDVALKNTQKVAAKARELSHRVGLHTGEVSENVKQISTQHGDAAIADIARPLPRASSALERLLKGLQAPKAQLFFPSM